VRIPTPTSFTPHEPDLKSRLEDLSAQRGIYLLTFSGAKPHLGWSINLHRRLSRFLASSYPGSGFMKPGFRERIVDVSCWPTGSRLEDSLMLYELARIHFPREYRKVLRLRMPWFVALTLGNLFPRLDITNRLPESGPVAYGPFRTRDAAQVYQQQVEALFQIRRCTEALAPHPDHPGCIYGEMNQCMRPCQCAVSADEYAHEVGRVAELLATNGKSSLSVLAAARDRASEEMEFEQASQIQKRIEKVESAAKARDEVIRAASELNGVALTRSGRHLEFKLWPMMAGIWQPPVLLDFSSERDGGTSLDSEIRGLLSGALEQPDATGNRLEQLAVFTRWYYSSWRDGSWFPFRSLADLNYRRLVREISKMAEESRTLSTAKSC
jgi:excinuclease ABC subunit C